MKFKIFSAAAAAGVLLMSSASYASQGVSLKPSSAESMPLVHAAVAPTVDQTIIKSLPLKDAIKLMKSDDGSAWSIVQVQGPACTSSTKKCQSLKRDCSEADKFAHKYSLHAACSELYLEATVLLTPKYQAVSDTEVN